MYVRWLLLTPAVFGALTLILALLMSALNGALVNNVLFPVNQFLPMFNVLWHDNPTGALQLLANKSLLAVAHFDDYSGLYLWSLEFDALSLAGYFAISGFLARLIAARTRPQALSLAGLALIGFAVTWVTAAAHCAGATWAGFVALYGLGVEKFPVNTTWQWLFAGIGVALLIVGARRKPA